MIRGALIMPYPSALGPADEPLTIEWPEGHSYAVVATTFHGGAVLGTTATEDEAMGDLRSVARDELQVRLPGYRHPRRVWGLSSNGTGMYAKGCRPGAATPPQVQSSGPVAHAVPRL